MPLKQDTLQRQLEVAQADRAAIEAEFAGKELKKQPKWRRANALVNSLTERLQSAQSRSAVGVAEESSDDAAEE